MARTTKPAPITRSAVVVACFDPPCARYLKAHKDGHFTHCTSAADATPFASEEAAWEVFGRYAAKPRGAWGGGVMWRIFEMTTKVSFAEVRQEPRAPAGEKLPHREAQGSP